MIGFRDRLAEAQSRHNSILCVGLDPDPERMPRHLLRHGSRAAAVREFNIAVIEATAPSACCYKLNLAFYEALGHEGLKILEETVTAAGRSHLVIADGKRSDIGNTARFYAEALFENMGFDACTVSPYMGGDAVRPFLAFQGRGAFVLVRTSNEGAGELQELDCGGVPLYGRTASLAATWASGMPGNLGFVVGATDAEALRRIRAEHPETMLLVPGIGAQGGDVKRLLDAVAHGSGPVVVNSSRQIIYASTDQDFAEAAGREAELARVRLAGGA